ncbi:MAG: hypothetical protein AB7E77_02665, partial [Desulfobulbus sp.]
MRTLLFLLFVIISAVAGFSVYPPFSLNAILTGAVVYLLIEVFLLRRRVNRLERHPVPSPRATRTTPDTTTDARREQETAPLYRP